MGVFPFVPCLHVRILTAVLANNNFYLITRHFRDIKFRVLHDIFLMAKIF